MAKIIVEDCLQLPIALFRKGSFKSSNWGNISLFNKWGNVFITDYSIHLDTPSYFNLSYTRDEQEDTRQTFTIETTNCNFGGVRNWFICQCGMRVGVLYKPYFADTFACRHCYNLTYESRNLSGSLKAIGKPLSIPELDMLKGKVKRSFYNGKPTKNFIKYQTKIEQFKTYHSMWSKNFRRSIRNKTK